MNATRLALRRTGTSALRCTSESGWSAASSAPACLFARETLRAARPAPATHRTPRASTQCRAYGTPAYQSYGLPSNVNAPPPPNAESTEHEVALPVVNETRPPKQQQQQQQHTTGSPSNSSESIGAATSSAAAQTSTSSAPSASTEQKPGAAAAATPTAADSTTAKPAPAKRPRSKLRARKAPIKLTSAAVEQLREMLEGPDGAKLLKVGVRNRGCSGLAYSLEWVDKPGSFDEEVMQDGVKVVIDSKALFSIIGSEMDWVEDKLSAKFVFKNPNIKEECGCGESFMV